MRARTYLTRSSRSVRGTQPRRQRQSRVAGAGRRPRQAGRMYPSAYSTSAMMTVCAVVSSSSSRSAQSRHLTTRSRCKTCVRTSGCVSDHRAATRCTIRSTADGYPCPIAVPTRLQSQSRRRAQPPRTRLVCRSSRPTHPRFRHVLRARLRHRIMRQRHGVRVRHVSHRDRSSRVETRTLAVVSCRRAPSRLRRCLPRVE